MERSLQREVSERGCSKATAAWEAAKDRAPQTGNCRELILKLEIASESPGRFPITDHCPPPWVSDSGVYVGPGRDPRTAAVLPGSGPLFESHWKCRFSAAGEPDESGRGHNVENIPNPR